MIHLDSLRLSADFIKGLQASALNDPTFRLFIEAAERLRDPPHDQPEIDWCTRLAVDLYLGNASETAYETNREAIQRCFPDIDLHHRATCEYPEARADVKITFEQLLTPPR